MLLTFILMHNHYFMLYGTIYIHTGTRLNNEQNLTFELFIAYNNFGIYVDSEIF